MIRVKNADNLRGNLPKPMEARAVLKGARKAEKEISRKGIRWA